MSDFKDTVSGVSHALLFTFLLSALFGNFFVRFPEVPVWWVWLFWANPLQHAFGALAINELYYNNLYSSSMRCGARLFVCRAHHGDRTTLIAYGYWIVESSAGHDDIRFDRWLPICVVAGFAAVVFLASCVTLSMRKQ